MTAPAAETAAPPQPPLRDHTEAPPVVDGIESQTSEMPTETSTASSDDDTTELVRRGDLAAFAELFARFQTRVERAATGRKHRPLREAWDAAAAEILRKPDRIDLFATSGKVVDALRLGCESGKVVVVDACLDCIHRLFEYGHIGSPGDSTDIALDARDGSLDDLVAIVCSCLEVKDEDVYMRMVQTLLTASTRTRSGLHHSTLLAAVRTIYNIFLNARVPGTRTTARVSLTQILNLVFARMEAETAEDVTPIPASFESSKEESSESAPAVDVPEPARPAEEGGDANSEFATVLQKDAYLLFRALCKLSAREEADALTPDNVGLRSKLLSLELLRNVINNSGPAFRSGDRFIYALRQYLSPSLLTNCMSNYAEVMDVSFDIFEMLLRRDTLRPLLKTELCALFDTVIFRFLESPTAGPMRRRRAITLLNRLSSDRQTMADLFLNYDCDLDSPKVFERIVNVLSSAAQDKTFAASEMDVAASTPGAGQVNARIMALTAVVQIVHSLRDWSKPIEESREQTKTIEARESQDEASQPYRDEDEEKEKVDLHTGARLASNMDERSNDSTIMDSTSTKSPSRIRSSGSSGLVLGTISEGNDRDTSRFEEALKAKRDVAEGVTLFNTKPKRGIEHLVATGRLKEDTNIIADFLHKTENLDATMVGEYLGEGGTFNISVMHAYTDLNDFTNLTFDGALRKHLSGFRLPGEAQKIDRIMEKFASRYCECNPDVFANADAAYVLAYSIIMLHTDAHNDTIKHKMSKDEFIKNNRGINDGGDLDPAFLGALYDRITTTEIRLVGFQKDSKTGVESNALDSATAAAAMDPTQRARQFKEESERLMVQTKVLFASKRRTAQDYTYYSATNVYHARLMFDVAWCPVLAAISLNLEEASPSQTNIVALCLDGFRHGIAIASTFGMTTTKDALVSSLAKFTHLNSISEMRPKNVECVRMILAIAALEGNNLGEQWIVIVRAISQLEQIRAVASGNPEKYVLQKTPLVGIGPSKRLGVNGVDTKSSSRSAHSSSTVSGSVVEGKTSHSSGISTHHRRSPSGKAGSVVFEGNTKAMSDAAQRVDSKAASMATSIAESEIDRIFTNSSQLTATGVADFCGALCAVALEELGEDIPRLFCLQKIIEMAYYNMESRTRIQWGKIWLKMGPFFSSAMCHANRDVAMYSIDALRQLASKFLDKDELSNFSFQRAFLKPFEVCFSRSRSVPIRELVLTCVSQIVLARAANIKSGWKSVFAVLALAADDKIESIMNFGWQIVDSIVRKYIGVLDDVYVDAVTGISAYTRSSVSNAVSLAAIDLLCGRCASSLADGRALSVLREQIESNKTKKETKGGDSTIIFSDMDAHIGAWFPILTGLASAVQDDRAAIQMAANNGLYKVLSDHGGKFSPALWALVFRGVLAPIFDDVKHLSASSDRSEAAAVDEWATTIGSASLKSLVDVFVKHIAVTRELLKDLLELVQSWVLQETEVVACEGVSVITRLVMTAGEVFEPEDWKIVVDAIDILFVETMPHEILGPAKGSNEKESSDGDINGRHDSIVNVPDGVSESNNNDIRDEVDGFEETELATSGHVPQQLSQDSQTSDTAPPRKIDFRVVRAKCVVQLLLIQLTQEIVVSFYRVLSTKDILDLSHSLAGSYAFAHDFNADIELRYSLWRTGFMNQVPNLLKQETDGLMAYLRIVFWLYLDPKRAEEGGSTEEKVMELCETVLRGYISSCREAQSKSEERQEVVALSPVVCFIVNGMMQMSWAQFESHLPKLYVILLDLLEDVDETEVRHAVTRLFRARIKPVAANMEFANRIMEDNRDLAALGVAQPQLPGAIRERIIWTELSENGGQTSTEICAALNEVGGVRSVVASNDNPNTFCVISSAPDEMLVAGVMSLPFVISASVEATSEPCQANTD